MALYRAKADGRGRYRFFEAEMDAQMQARRVEIAKAIRKSKSLLLLVERILRKRRKARAMRAAAQAFTASPQ